MNRVLNAIKERAGKIHGEESLWLRNHSCGSSEVRLLVKHWSGETWEQRTRK